MNAWQRARKAVLDLDAHLIADIEPRPDFADGSQACLADPTAFDLVPTGDEYATEAARRICRRCDLRLQCLAWAVAFNEHGVWGGRTELDRRRIRRIIRTRNPKEAAS